MSSEIHYRKIVLIVYEVVKEFFLMCYFLFKKFLTLSSGKWSIKNNFLMILLRMKYSTKKIDGVNKNY